MRGINTYEERIKNPNIDLINWEEIANYPECRLIIWNKYMTDPYFKQEINMRRSNNVFFNYQFKKYFKSYLIELEGQSRILKKGM